MCIGLICPCVSSAECCGDYEIYTTPTTVAIGRELNDASTYLRNALNAVPYVSGASSSNIGFQDVTADIGISACILTWNCTVTIARGYVLAKGNA